MNRNQQAAAAEFGAGVCGCIEIERWKRSAPLFVGTGVRWPSVRTLSVRPLEKLESLL